MLRHILLLILLSVLAVFFAREFAWLVSALDKLFFICVHALDNIFAHNYWGHVAANAISLTIIPLLMTALPAFIYWIITRRHIYYYFYFISWMLWLMLAVSVIWHR